MLESSGSVSLILSFPSSSQIWSEKLILISTESILILIFGQILILKFVFLIFFSILFSLFLSENSTGLGITFHLYQIEIHSCREYFSDDYFPFHNHESYCKNFQKSVPEYIFLQAYFFSSIILSLYFYSQTF